jgi:phage shock protein C
MASKKLMRSREYNMIAGVMGGIAEYLGWSPFKVRLLFVIVSSCKCRCTGYFNLFSVVVFNANGRGINP